MPGLDLSPRWRLLSPSPGETRSLEQSLGVSPLVARVLAGRGLTDLDVARDFLNPSLDRDWQDPLVIPGMSEVADRVERAVRRHERIAVFGDFDVDGITATCLLTLALAQLGADVHPFIPHRFGEGYGLSRPALERVRAGCDPQLLVTVDNGIASGAEVARLVELGIDVCITDHHEPGDAVPEGVPVTDPKLSEDCPSRELAGVGVALKLVAELGRRMGRADLWRRYVELATLGTLSDMMLLTGENRSLVAEGVSRMRTSTRPGIVALAATAGIDLAQVTADTLPFSLIPRLNAAGRMGTTDVAFDLLYTNDPAEAAVLAGKLEEINDERRAIESSLASEALAKVAATYRGGRCIVVGGEGWHEGVKGIVASRIVNRYHVPTILFSLRDGIARGSGRSVGSVDLFHAVEQCSDLLVRFGGHAGAVGVTIEADRLDEFRSRLEAVLDELPAEQFVDKGEVAAEVGLSEISVGSIASLERLQPFGQGNKKPLFAARAVTMRNRARVGADGSHLRFVATDGVASVSAIMFRAPDIERAASWDGAVDLVFEAVNETWQGRTKPKLMVRDILYRDGGPDAADPSSESVADALFKNADAILARDEYAGLADAESFATKAVGVTFEGRQDVLACLAEGARLDVVRQPDNPYDGNAMALVASDGRQVGYLRRQVAAAIAPVADAGVAYEAYVLGVTGGDGQSLGVNIRVSRVVPPEVQVRRSPDGASGRGRLAALSEESFLEVARRHMIGDHPLLPAQEEALRVLGAHRSCLAVMATGRGKSLIFHLHAARRAILDGRASVFVYPLRALVADQAFHLKETFADLGMGVEVLTGETPLDEREEVFSRLADGSVDVVLTTPEFLVIHARRFAATRRVGFVVVDEAHHAGLSKGGNRGAYASLPEVLDLLGRPEALAVTATAATPVAAEVCRLLGIARDDVIQDRSVRDNLKIDDLRGISDRESALVRIACSGEKCVVYVNSREQSVSLARMLRRRVPELGHKVSFYNAGLTRSERTRVEDAFRSGELRCIVSTSAFGEGVNLPDIRHIVLYHLPFGQIEFNQMSGRAGRDGEPAQIHLMFGERDRRINERVLGSQAPARNDLAALYRELRACQAEAASRGEESFAVSNAELASRVALASHRTRLDERSVSCGVSIFRELGFLTTQGYGSARRVAMVPHPAHAELTSSVRYLEGLRAAADFRDFSQWVLSSECDDLLMQINRPIVPDFGRVVDG